MPKHRAAFIIYHLAFIILLAACNRYDTPPRILVFSKTNGYRHESIEVGKNTLVKICSEQGILADTTEDAALFNEKNLRRYAAVVFLNTNGEVLNPGQECAFERYIQAGGGYAGVHSASATEYTWRWYGGLVGAYFKDHPAIQDIHLEVKNCQHPASAHLGCKAWNWKEEPYNFRHYEPDIQVLLSADENSYKGASHPATNNTHPVSWYHNYDGGRAFYTALGHIPDAYKDPAFQQHLLGGIRYAIGENRPLRYDRCRTEAAPDPTRFVKTTVASDLDEPMEIAQFPDGKIILIERHGYIKLFNPATGLLNTVHKLPVYSEMGDGLLGVAIDPHWTENRWIYLYYSSLQDSLNQLSRFRFQGDTLDRNSEKTILQIPVGHKDCFHAAGSMAFDAEGNLLLATGDNTSPFNSDGFSPIDERPGRQAFDAQRSAANTRDLRGKILRIKIQPDGRYTCPASNLFSQEREAGRPEIYVMGCRNPFRISYDHRRNFLYWGDIGPDAGKADTARGPLGHDEINRARAAGFFGWPYFVADNQAYRDFDFQHKTSGKYFDPEHPVNESLNNTGQRTLPPAQPAFIWYPYGKNRDFPILGTGGRNAMAGPVYYADEYPQATRFPDYYHSKLIIYDWMRGWLMAVTMDSLGNFQRLEPMADSVKLSRPMDMFFDKNGSLWVLEYGTRWYSSNEDARLSRIDFVRGNRPPIAVLEAQGIAGAAPFEAAFNLSKTKDYDGDPLSFELDFGDNQRSTVKGKPSKIKKQQPISHTYQRPGIYEAVLKVTDAMGALSTSKIQVAVGNEAPQLRWDLSGRNRSFYKADDTLNYKIMLRDREDGDLWEGRIDPKKVETSCEILEKAPNPAMLFAQFLKGEKVTESTPGKFSEGKLLVEKSDCKSCHAVDKQVNGPAFQAVAERYRSNKVFAVPSVYRKIIYGSSGNWGQSAMIPHPQIREEEAIQMALWILSLSDPPKPPAQELPLFGSLPLRANTQASMDNGKKSITNGQPSFLLRARYFDAGANGLPALFGGEMLLLRPSILQAENCDRRSEGVGNYKPFDNDTTVLNELKHNAYFVIQRADLTGVRSLTLRMGYGDRRAPQAGGRLEVRVGSPQGELLGELVFESKNAEKMLFEERVLSLQQPTRNLPDAPYCDVFFIFKNLQNQGQGVMAVDWLRFDF